MKFVRAASAAAVAAACLSFMGCAPLTTVPTSGPSTRQVQETGGYEVATLTRELAQAIARAEPESTFASLPAPTAFNETIAVGDVVEIALWETAPAMLLGGPDATGQASGRSLAVPGQVVRLDGSITMPFVGRMAVAGQSPAFIEAQIVKALEGRANRPQALVRAGSAVGQEVTVVGGVRNNLRLGLTARRERVLDAIAVSGGSTFPIEKSVVQVTRGGAHASVPLDTVVRDPRQNVVLAPADVVTVYHQPRSFVALGAVAKVGDVAFEATGLDLAQAIARAGGTLDSRADAGGVFIARQVGDRPTIYRLDLRAPGSLFVMRDFKVRDQDIIYVANATAAELQKFLGLLGAAVYPIDAAARNLGSN